MHLALYYLHKRYLSSQLSKGNLTSHERFSLVLLCSQPDTIRRFPLRKDPHVNTTFLGQPYSSSPRQDITPARAVCRYRAPLSPRLHGSFINFLNNVHKYTKFPAFCQYQRDPQRSHLENIEIASRLRIDKVKFLFFA